MGGIGEFGQIRKDAIPGIIRSIPMVKSADSVTDREAKSQSYSFFVIVPVQLVTFAATQCKSSRSMDLAQHRIVPDEMKPEGATGTTSPVCSGVNAIVYRKPVVRILDSAGHPRS
jgi:hypothetical protein